jgi:hypothetical protein
VKTWENAREDLFNALDAWYEVATRLLAPSDREADLIEAYAAWRKAQEERE